MTIKIKSSKSAQSGHAKAGKPLKEVKLSRTHPPTELAPLEWQRGLRRQFGREQTFGLENIGAEPFFSQFRVSNALSKSAYRVAIRGQRPGDNYCACPDYGTNELGTCKHIEFVLAALEKKRGAKTAFARGYQPAFSEICLRSDSTHTVHFRPGTDCPATVRKAAALLFDEAQDWQLRDQREDGLERFMALVAKNEHELRTYDDALDFLAGRRDAQRRSLALNDLFPRGISDSSLKKLLKVPLYPYPKSVSPCHKNTLTY